MAQHCPEDIKPQPGGSWDIADYMLIKKLYCGEQSVLNILTCMYTGITSIV